MSPASEKTRKKEIWLQEKNSHSAVDSSSHAYLQMMAIINPYHWKRGVMML